MKNKKGFTLVELLAVIVILAMVISITMYIAVNVIKNAREKTYQVTINNITTNSGNYLLENKDLFFITDADNKYEYQCITVQNLIDMGYLSNEVTKSKVSDDRTVNPSDNIYLERDINTKALVKNVYVVDSDSVYGNVCNVIANAEGTIDFAASPDMSEWARSKEVTITYKLKNLGNNNDLPNYKYGYEFEETENGTFNNRVVTQKVTVTSEGTITATIKRIDELITTGSFNISKIDRLGPVITLSSNPTGYLHDTATLVLNVTDTQSGVNYDTFTKEDIEVTIGGVNITTIELTKKDNNGNYNLVINDTEHSGAVVIKIKEDTVFDNVENGNIETNLPVSAEWRKVTQIPTAVGYCSNPTYNGSSQDIVKAAGTGYTWTNGVARTDAGSQDVTASLSSGYIWNDNTVTDKKINCSLASKSVAISWGTTTSFTYNDSAQAPTASATSGVSGETINITRTTATNVGNHTSTASCSSVTGGMAKCGNYALTNTTKAFSITKAQIAIPTCAAKTYNGSEQILFSNGTGYTAGGTTKGTNAGTYTATATPTANYTWTDGTTTAKNVSCTINKKSVAVSWGTTTTFTYSGSAQAPTVTTPVNGVTVSGTTEKINITRTTATNVGNHTSTASCSSVTGGMAKCGNYALTNTTKAFSITKASIAIPTCAAKTYNGSEQTLFSNGTGYTAGGTTKGTNAGTYTATATPTANYTWTDGTTTAKNVSCTINKKSLTIDAWSANLSSSTSYTRSGYSTGVGSQTITLTYTPYTNTAGEYTYATSAGSGKYTLSLSNANYSIGNAGKFTINGKFECWYSQGYSSGCFAEPIKTSTKIWAFAGDMYITIDAKTTNNNKPDGCSYYYPGSNGNQVYINICDNSNEWFRVQGLNCWVWGGFFKHQGSEDPTTGACRNVNAGGCPSGSYPTDDGRCIGGCFLAGTKVKTIYGFKDIDKIIVGDMVLSYNEKTGKNEYKTVEEIFIHNNQTEYLYSLIIDNKLLKVTGVHRFYIRRNNKYLWIAANKLKIGDMVRYADGTYHKITAISYSLQTNTVYNFRVADNHNYYVTNDMILVHNEKVDDCNISNDGCVTP